MSIKHVTILSNVFDEIKNAYQLLRNGWTRAQKKNLDICSFLVLDIDEPRMWRRLKIDGQL